MRRAIVLSILVMFLGGAMAACNTIEGMGEDLQDLGRAMKGASKSNRKNQ